MLKRWFAAIALIVLALPTTIASAQVIEREGEPELIFNDHAESGMVDAIDKARASLPHFWATKADDDNGATDFFIKAGLPTTGGNLEHIWIDGLVQNADGSISGLLANEPYDLAGELAFEDEVTFTPDAVTDWTYTEDDLMRAHFTTRILMADMPPENVIDMMTSLHTEPLP